MTIRLSAFADEAGSALSEQIAALKRNRISLVELRNVDGVNVWDWTEEKAEAIRNALSEAKISVWSIGSPIGKVPVDVNLHDYLIGCKKIFRIAGILGTTRVRAFSFFGAYDAPSRVVAHLREIVSTAADYGIEIYHENEKEIFGDTPERVLYLLNHVNGLKSVFDPANYVQCGKNVRQALEELSERTDYYHIKDIDAETGEIVPAGLGDGDIDCLIAGISGDKTLTVEPHLRVFEGYDRLDGNPLKNRYCFSSFTESFDCAVTCLKKELEKGG